jgi:putative glutamine amidotransferase
MTRPIIGITSYLTHARWGPWDKPAALVPQGYVAAVAAAGGRAVLLPPDLDGIDETLARLDGLIFCGGPDILPAQDGGAAESLTDPFAPERDAAERRLLIAALERDLPLLGVCRGMQLINLIYGGTLVGHLPDVVGHDEHRRRVGAFDLHPVELDPGTIVGRLLGGRAAVHSSHHQGVDQVGKGLVPSGRAPDGTVEAIEDPSRRFVVGVLWHPEEDADVRLFAALVNAARARDEGDDRGLADGGQYANPRTA